MNMYDVLLARQLGAGGGGGATNYNALSNKPQINGVELQGDKSFSDLGLGTSVEKAYTNTVTDGGTDLPTSNAVYDFVQPQIDTIRLMMDATVYGFRIDKQDSNPETRVEYLYDAVGMTPARMNFQTGQFDYGSWANAWFITGNKPCALKFDGTVDYYLDPDDYTKKADGTASDVSDSSYAGNFMASMPTVWIKRWEDERYQYVAIASRQINDDFKAYAHDAGDGFINDMIYLPMFKGVIVDSKLRSIAGVYPGGGTSASQEVAAAESCGNGWQIWDWSKNELIADLLTLISKSTNSQISFGNGATGTYDESDAHKGILATGSNSINTGQFYGADDALHHVKVFHIEDFWGNRADTCLGLNSINVKYVYKLTKPYSITPDGTYTTTDLDLPSSGYQTQQSVGNYGSLPKSTGGSSSTYVCDYFTTASSADNRIAVAGGACNRGDECGAYYLAMRIPGYTTYWSFGASPCYNAPHLS